MTLKLFFLENTKNFCTYEHKSKLFGLLAGNNVVISVSVLPETTMSFVARMPNNLDLGILYQITWGYGLFLLIGLH